MLVIPPPKFRKHRGRPKRKAPATVSNAPILTAATYEPTSKFVLLMFDRAIDISALDGSWIAVNDPVINNEIYRATGEAVLLTPTQLRIGLLAYGDGVGAVILLNAGPGNGIVAADSSVAWAGVPDTPLPFP